MRELVSAGAAAPGAGRSTAERPSTGSLRSSPSIASTPTGSPLGPKKPPFTPATASTRSAIELTRSRRAIRSFDSTARTRPGSTVRTLIRSAGRWRTIVVHSTPCSTWTPCAVGTPPTSPATRVAAVAIPLRTPDRLGCPRDPVRPSGLGELHEGADPPAAARDPVRARDGRPFHGRDPDTGALRPQPGRPDPGAGAGRRADDPRVRRDPGVPRRRHRLPPLRPARPRPRAPVDALRAEPNRGGVGVRAVPEAVRARRADPRDLPEPARSRERRA